MGRKGPFTAMVVTTWNEDLLRKAWQKAKNIFGDMLFNLSQAFFFAL